VCGGPFGLTIYTIVDKSTMEKKHICHDCFLLPRVCFFCGMPVKDDYTSLPDGRFLCARDAKTAVLEENQANEICRQTRESLDRLFCRFLAFPSTNLSVAVIDRVQLEELFKFAGRDRVCPNVWGCAESQVRGNHFEHSVSLLSGLPLAVFRATCAHELTHTWINENLSPQRKRTLGRDAEEGFCELVSFLLMSSESDESQQQQILRNAYTRGQIQLLIDAEKQYGFSDVVDWMKYGLDDRLRSEDLSRIRRVEAAPSKERVAPAFPVYAAQATAAPDTLQLKGISWARNHRLALINDRTFEVQEKGTVHVGHTNVVIRCLAIEEDSVRIQIVGSGQQQELRFKE